MNKRPIVKCPKCIGGQMLYDNLDKRWVCIQCSMSYDPSVFVKESAKAECK